MHFATIAAFHAALATFALSVPDSVLDRMPGLDVLRAPGLARLLCSVFLPEPLAKKDRYVMVFWPKYG